MINLTRALTAAADQVHRTHCAECEYDAPCPGFTDVEVGVAAAVIDTFITHNYTALRRALWDAHNTIKP